MNIQTIQMIDVHELDKVVEDTYNRPYSFQQQEGCKSRGTESFTVPEEGYDYENDTLPEEVNHSEMGVSFKAWLARDPKQKLDNPKDHHSWTLDLWWGRNFYPHPQMILNDLHSKGILPAGSYTIDIDW